jgi:hypothetical protein
MTDSSNGWHFKHGLDPDFMTKLKVLAEQGGWFADVLADPDLILGIRNNYMNVYWRGQSLFKIVRSPGNGPLKFSTHPKYLIDPNLSKAVMFDGKAFQVGGHKALTTEYGPETLGRMKQAAKPYVGDEKKGVHAVMRAPANPNVIDTEVAFNNEAPEEEHEPLIPRIDLACLEEVKGEIRLRFWEAKLYGNPELRAAGDKDAPVVEQVRRYRELIEKHRDEIVGSYRVVAGNLVEMAKSAMPPREVGELVKEVGEPVKDVATEKPFVIDETPFVGLAFYGYDAADKESKSWNNHIGKLKKKEGMVVRCAGNAKDIKLRGTDSD